MADYIAVNLSSPNTPGLRDLQSAQAAAALLARLQEEQALLTEQTGRRVPIALKVAPDLGEDEISELSDVFLSQNLDALIATNTTIERDQVAGHPLAREAGGLSGAPLTGRSTEVISAFHRRLAGRIPIIGVGGIMSADDALEKLAAGATLVQIYTGFIYQGPELIHEILDSVVQIAS